MDLLRQARHPLELQDQAPLRPPAWRHRLQLNFILLKQPIWREANCRRVLVCGGLDYTDRAELYAKLDRLQAEYAFGTIIAGGAPGVDTLAVEWAQGRGIATQVFMAQWGTLRRTLGQLRNARILAEYPTRYCACFPRGGRRTANMVKQAKAVGISVLTVDS